jgi:hypothetical protein
MPCTLVTSYQCFRGCNTSIPFYPEGEILLSVRAHVSTHQKTGMFITTVMTASFHAYVQAVSYGIEYSSICNKIVEYCVLFDTLREECK